MLLEAVLLIGMMGVFPYNFTYEGRLYDQSGNVYNGEAEFILRLYDAQEGGTSLWEESQRVDVKDGFFSIKVGSVNPLPDPFPSSVYLGVEVNSSGEMSPRLEVGSVPFSFLAKKALNTDRSILRYHTESKYYLNKCISDPATCCFKSNPVYYNLPGAAITGRIKGRVLILFSISFIALSDTPVGETRGYGFKLYVNGNPVGASFRACSAVVPWGLCNVSIAYQTSGSLPEGEHTFEVKYCAVNDNVTGEARTYDYSFHIVEMP